MMYARHVPFDSPQALRFRPFESVLANGNGMAYDLQRTRVYSRMSARSCLVGQCEPQALQLIHARALALCCLPFCRLELIFDHLVLDHPTTNIATNGARARRGEENSIHTPSSRPNRGMGAVHNACATTANVSHGMAAAASAAPPLAIAPTDDNTAEVRWAADPQDYTVVTWKLVSNEPSLASSACRKPAATSSALAFDSWSDSFHATEAHRLAVLARMSRHEHGAHHAGHMPRRLELRELA